MNCLKRPSRSPGSIISREMESSGVTKAASGKKQAVQSIGYSVNHEESDGGAVGRAATIFPGLRKVEHPTR